MTDSNDADFDALCRDHDDLYTEKGSFGWAINVLQRGGRVARAGWNGKNMWLILVPGSPELTVDEGRPLHKAGLPLGMSFSYAPHIDMFTADKKLVPWLASQTDVLATDWTEVV